MTGSAPTITAEAREALFAALGDNPTIVVDNLKGDASKGEPITNGALQVVDRESEKFPGVIRDRVVLVGDVVIYGVLVAASDRLTHEKAANMLRSLARLVDIAVREPKKADALEGDNG
jgi:pyrimidine operon attenuation protein/uracil phosphoribosyltransferase